MKFKHDIEAQAGFKDKDGQLGSAGQILSSTGSQTDWIDQSTLVAGSTEVVEVPVKNLMGSELKKGDPVYISGSVGASGRLEVKLADASDSAKMPAVGLLKQDLADNAEGFVVVTGKLRNLITSPIDGATPDPNDVIYVKPNGIAGAALTLTKPTGSSNLIQNMGKVGRVSTSNDGTFIVSSILRSNDVPNLSTGKIWVGNGNTVESTVVHLDETNGRMGIGTTSPSAKLHIEGDGSIIRLQNNNSDTNGTFIDFRDSTGTRTGYVGTTGTSDDMFLFTQGAKPIRFYTDASERMRINSSGNVGIGTTSPSQKLDVAGIIRITESGNTAFYGGNYLRVFNDQIYTMRNTSGNQRFAFDNSSGSLSTYNSSNTRTTYLNNAGSSYFNGGNVGIGTTNPSDKLHVSDGSFRVQSSGNSRGVKINVNGEIDQTSSVSDWLHLQRNHNGLVAIGANSTANLYVKNNVGIGTTSPSRKLDVNGHIQTRDNLYVGKAGENRSDYSIEVGAGRSGNGNAYIDLTGDTTYSDYGLRLIRGNTGANATSEIAHRGTGLFKINARESANIALIGGNVGIETTSPSEKLSVASGNIAINNSTSFMVGGATGDTIVGRLKNTLGVLTLDGEGTRSIRLGSATNGEVARIDNTNSRVGIGTTSPQTPLHISGGTSASPTVVRIENTDTTIDTDQEVNTIQFYSNDVSASGTGITSKIAQVAENPGNQYGLAFYTYNLSLSEALRISETGNVGIGTTSPGFTSGSGLEIEKQGTATLRLQSAGSHAGEINQTTSAFQIADLSSGTMIFKTSNAERMRINSSGNVGIRTTNPNDAVVIKTNTDGKGLTIQRNSTTVGTYSQLGFLLSTNDAGDANVWIRGYRESPFSNNYMTFGTNSSEKMRITSAGNVGIGTTSPGQKLHVNGSMTASNYYLHNNNTRGMTAWLGDPRLLCSSFVYVTDTSFNYKPIKASAFTVSSDYRLKSNIAPLDNAISRLNQLEVHRFNWNDRLDEPKVDGFIAHEVATVIPEAVLGEKDATFEDGTPDYQGIDQAKIVPLLTAALQEALQKIENLETRIQALENN